MSAPQQDSNSGSDRRTWLETGVQGLDTVLAGGLLQGGVYLVEGQAGTGKTILGFQCGLTYARRGERVLVVTLLAESHGRLIDHLRDFDFFDGAVIARSFQLLSGYTAAKAGLSELRTLLAQAVLRERPRLLIIDGFAGTRAFAADEADYAHFLLELGALVAAGGCTALLLSTVDGQSRATQHALVDGIIELSTAAFGVRRIREIEVHKFRGGNPIAGRHALTISRRGIHVYPRFEAVRTRQVPQTAKPSRKLALGVPELDAMLFGGLLEGSTTSLIGAPGVGKTILALKFLEEGVRQGERGVYFGFYEQAERLLAKANGVCIDLHDAVASDVLKAEWHAPLEVLLDEIVERLLELVEEHRPTRLVLDGMAGLRDAVVNVERDQPFTAALLHELKALGVTTLVTEELPLFTASVGMTSRSAAFVENIIHLRYVEAANAVTRVISMVKVRDGDHDPGIRPYTVSTAGFDVAKLPGAATPSSPSSA